ncbi:MAG: LLM class flavin-dependent oxidoreductase [Pseudomonadales bacterium]|nr:LLM class flavin-dependent oxidoreductase [Pseudomonadales bacterium]
MSELKIGMATPVDFWRTGRQDRAKMLDDAWHAGVNHIFMADHVSFRNGSGKDGMVEIAALSQLHDEIAVMTGIYLLPLRHPLPVARQLSTLSEIAPGRILFGIGIGGEDRHEVEICGVDPRTRGKRTNESLAIIRGLLAGETVDFDGEIFQIEKAIIRPRPVKPIPVIVGGRSNAALERTGLYGDGWIGTWCSVRRFEEAIGIIDGVARTAGRQDINWQHGYQPWVGVADTREEARARVAAAMEAFYHVPFEQFERYVPYGTPEDVAGALQPYVSAGCRIMNLKVVAGNDNESLQAVKIIAGQLQAD